jgi:hypothetical protein
MRKAFEAVDPARMRMGAFQLHRACLANNSASEVC